MKLKVTSFLLSISLLVTSLPFTAFALPKDTVEVMDYLAEIGYEELELNSSQRSEKVELQDYTKDLSELVEDVDYSANRINYMADTEAEALKIAECYNARLVFYDYGIAAAEVDFNDEQDLKAKLSGAVKERIPTDVPSLIALAADTSNNLPAIYPSTIFCIDDEENSAKIENVSEPEQSNLELPETAQERAAIIEDENEIAEDQAAIIEDENEIAENESELTGRASDYPKAVSANAYVHKQWAHKYIDSAEAWNDGVAGEGVVVAVVDTGVDLKHPDLIDNLTDYCYNPIAKDGIYKDIYNNPNDASDDNGHGTHCAGIIAATNNDIGVVGVAYNAQIMPIKVLDYKGFGSQEYVIAGINAAVEHDADIISLSLGGPVPTPLYAAAVNNAINKGKIVIAAAGNDGYFEFGALPNYPAGYEGVISVAALSPGFIDDLDLEDAVSLFVEEGSSEDEIAYMENVMLQYEKEYGAVLAKYSQYTDGISVSAPGTAIYSTFVSTSNYKNIGDYKKVPTTIESSYEYLNGTSMACPVVSGIAALVVSANSDIKKQGPKTAQYMDALLKQSGDGKIYRSDKLVSGKKGPGCVNASDAVKLAKSGDVKFEYELAAPRIVIEKNADGSYKGGANSTIIITNEDSYPKGTHFYYTLDGSAPSVKTAICYDWHSSLADVSGDVTINMIAEWYGTESEAASFSGNIVIPAEEIVIKNPAIKILPGKSAEIDLDINPSRLAEVKLTFESDNKAIIVDDKGIIKAAKDAAAGTKGVITVTDTISGIKALANVEVVDALSQKVEISQDLKKGITLYTRQPVDTAKVLPVSVNLIEKLSDSGSIDSQYFVIKSSNKSVVSVKDGVLYAKHAGKAKVTVKTNDGSNTKKTIKVTVETPMVEMNLRSDTDFELNGGVIENPNNIKSGVAVLPLGNKKCKVKINVTPNDDCSNGKVVYSVEKGKENIVKVSSSGIITPGKDAKIGDAANITVTAADGFGMSKSFTVKIYSPIKDLKITDVSGKLVKGLTFIGCNKNDVFSVYDIQKIDPNNPEYIEYQVLTKMIIPYYDYDKSSYTYLDDPAYNGYAVALLAYISDQPSIVSGYRSSSRIVVWNPPMGKKAKVTLMARDGSGKKVTLNYK